MSKGKIISFVTVVLLIGVGLFFSLKIRQQQPMSNVLDKMQPQITSSSSGEVSQNRPDMQGRRFPSGAPMPSLPEGSQPFMGVVANVSGSTFTVTGPMGELSISITSTTEFSGGSKTDIKDDMRVGGFGTKNADGTITAVQVQINPTMPERGQRPE